MFLSTARIIEGLTFVLATAAWGIGSILLVELVRDSYHALSHQVKWLHQHHMWHHKAFRSDFSTVSDEVYRQAHWHYDVPESVLMFIASCLFLGVAYTCSPTWATLAGALHGIYYTSRSVSWAVARGLGWKWAQATDANHKLGQFLEPPTRWTVNQSYHWRHHFDNPQAYFCGTYTFLDKLLGTAVSLQQKTIAVTGASGAVGQALLRYLTEAGAQVIALTSFQTEPITLEITGNLLTLETISCNVRFERELAEVFKRVDVLVLNQGENAHPHRTESAVHQSFEVNTSPSNCLLKVFLSTVQTNEHIAKKEVWVVTSETEVAPAQSLLYELSKRSLGDPVTRKRLDTPCVIRKIVLSGFHSRIFPKAPISADWVAQQIIKAVKRDTRNIIVSY